MEVDLNIDKLNSILKTWTQVECVRFAAWCARSVQHLNPDHRTSACIEAAETWLRDPSQANRVAAADAADAAYAAARASAARAADANAANAANAVGAAAYAAYAAAANAAYGGAAANAAGAAAANAAGACGHADVTDYDLLQAYIGDQILNAVNT